ncbi:MAG: LamG domain-containing protein [Pirellulales bacterium]
MKADQSQDENALRDLQQLIADRALLELAPDEARRLESLVLNNAKARRLYVEYMLDTSSLHWWAGGDATLSEMASAASAGMLSSVGLVSESNSDMGRPNCLEVPTNGLDPDISTFEASGETMLANSLDLEAGMWGPWQPALCFSLGALAATTLALGIAWSALSYSKPASQLAQTAVPSSPVAVLVSGNACDWGKDFQVAADIRDGNIRLGEEITLYQGIAEFRLSSGVSLSIEGPAALVLTSPMSLVMQHGKLTTYVPWSVGDFRVRSSCCQVVASDAEFGLQSNGNRVEIHAFAGDALVSPLPTDEPTRDDGEADVSADESLAYEAQLPVDSELSRVVVPMGRALKLGYDDNSTRVLSWRNAEEADFAARLSMAGPLPVTRQYVKAIKQAKPLAYWRFESIAGKQVANEVADTNTLKIRGAVRLTGSRENQSIEFGRPGERGYCTGKEPIEFRGNGEYSVELWAKPSHSHRAGMLTFAERIVNRNRKAAFSLETLSSGFSYRGIKQKQRIRFVHSVPPGLSVNRSSSCIAESPYEPRRWHHIVAVKEEDKLQLYIDGALSGTQSDSTRFDFPFFVVLGTRLLERTNDRSRDFVTFVGQLDEVAIYDHALSREEVSRHYHLIEWDPADKRSSSSKLSNSTRRLDSVAMIKF